MSIPFIDLQSQRERLDQDIRMRIDKVLAHGQYILGPEVGDIETALAEFVQTKHAVSCANGTDAIILALLALNIGPGDAVICPSFTYCATAEAIARIGAVPIFADIDPRTYNLDPKSVAHALSSTTSANIRAILAVDLFGRSADYPALRTLADDHGVNLISDCAQGFGTIWDDKHPGHWADLVTTSFFPAKPLGCYGDGGAVMTNNDSLANTLQSLRNHGNGVDKYDNIRIGMNSRLDSIQAAVLLSKMSIFADELETRNSVANRYSENLAPGAVTVPFVPSNIRSSWAQYTIEIDRPDQLMQHLRQSGIPSARYYPTPIHLQSAYRGFPIVESGLPATEAAMTRVISLPIHAYLSADTQDKIITSVNAFV